MSEAVAGKKIVYLYRVLEQAATESGTMIAFTTENGRTTSKDADSTKTKDGAIRTPSAAEVEITATTVLSKGEDGEIFETLETAMDEDKLIEIWEANLAEPVTGETDKFKGRYFQGYLTELEKTSNAEDNAEMSLTFGINGDGKPGNVTVTDAQQEQAGYVFTDTTPTGATGATGA